MSDAAKRCPTCGGHGAFDQLAADHDALAARLAELEKSRDSCLDKMIAADRRAHEEQIKRQAAERELAEAEEAIRKATHYGVDEEMDGADGHGLFKNPWFDLPAVKRALGEDK